MMELMSGIHNSIVDGTFPDYVKRFMVLQFPKQDYPKWAEDALRVAGIDLRS
jgi:queuine tRNA-ribosyltransferase